MTKLDALKSAVKLPGVQSAIAEKLTLIAMSIGLIPEGKSISQQSVYNWLTRQKQCPSRYARLISNVVDGEISVYQLRPDLYPLNDKIQD